MAYPRRFRPRWEGAIEAGVPPAEVAAQFHCSESWVRRLIQRRRELGTLDPLPPRRPDNRKLKEEDLRQLEELIAQKPDMTLGELAAALEKKVSVPTVHRATRKLKLPLKKSPSTPPSRTGRMSRKNGTGGSSSSGA